MDNSPVLQSLIAAFQSRTPARVLLGRSGGAYRTETSLALREDHAAAIDAVHVEIDLVRDFGPETVDHWDLFETSTQAKSKEEYLARPDLGRSLSTDSRELITQLCPRRCDIQVVIGDGLSVAAVRIQVPALLPLIHHACEANSWRFGRPFVVRHCRVGVMNDVGELLDPAVVVLLIGERPGLATAESLSAYLAYRPRAGHTDAQRNLVSNIHARGKSSEEAVAIIVSYALAMHRQGLSGVELTSGQPSLG